MPRITVILESQYYTKDQLEYAIRAELDHLAEHDLETHDVDWSDISYTIEDSP